MWFVSQPSDQCSHLYFTLFRPRQMGAELSHLEKLLHIMDLTNNSSDMSLSFFCLCTVLDVCIGIRGCDQGGRVQGQQGMG
jgi:hypothetical protein